MIEKILTLSTGHVNPNNIIDAFLIGADQTSDVLDTGALRSASHEYGWLVFVYPECPDVPEWLQAIHSRAVAEGCTVILFDNGAEVSDEFEQYDW